MDSIELFTGWTPVPRLRGFNRTGFSHSLVSEWLCYDRQRVERRKHIHSLALVATKTKSDQTFSDCESANDGLLRAQNRSHKRRPRVEVRIVACP
jgi:hypothetical protein